MRSIPLLPFLVAGVVAVVAVTVKHRTERRKQARATVFATRIGMRIDVDRVDPPSTPFDLFQVGRARRASYRMWREGSPDIVFEYQYTTGSGKNRTTHHRTCAIVDTGLAAPHTEIGPEGFFAGLGRMVGIRDIELESPEFNELYRVTGADERFAITLLDPAMIAWMLSPAGGGASVKMELLGPRLLCFVDRIDVEQSPGFLDWAQGFRAQIPRVVNDLYPAAR